MSTTTKLKGGIVGMGRMGITHFAILNTHPQVQMTAVCEESKQIGKLIAEHLNIKVYNSYREMLEQEPLDFIVVSTPPGSHLEIADLAIQKNIHIFLEKPFCLDAATANPVIQNASARRGLVTQVGYVNRFNEVFAEIQRLLSLGVLGQIKTFRSSMFGATIIRENKTGWRAKRQSGGGCLYEFASHAIDLVNFILGVPDTITGSVLQSVYSAEVEDAVFSTFSYHGGAVGQLVVNWSDESYRKPVNQLEFFGSNGRIIADKHGFKAYIKDPPPGCGLNQGWTVRSITDIAQPVRFYLRGNEFTLQLDHFIDCIRSPQVSNRCTFQSALATDFIIERILHNSNAK